MDYASTRLASSRSPFPGLGIKLVSFSWAWKRMSHSDNGARTGRVQGTCSWFSFSPCRDAGGIGKLSNIRGQFAKLLGFVSYYLTKNNRLCRIPGSDDARSSCLTHDMADIVSPSPKLLVFTSLGSGFPKMKFSQGLGASTRLGPFIASSAEL